MVYFKGREAYAIDYGQKIDKKVLKESDSLATINVPWDIRAILAQQMLDVWKENSLKTIGLFAIQKITTNHFPVVAEYQQELFQILTAFGYEHKQLKKKTG